MVKNLPAMQETWVQSLGQEDPPGKENGYPLQYSCLENPTDRGAWWAMVHSTFKLVVGEEQRVSEDGQAVGTDVQKF